MNIAQPKSNQLTQLPATPVFNRYGLSRHINKLRWLCLWAVFMLLILIPVFHIYQTHAAAHSYDLLTPMEKSVYDATQWLATRFTDDPENQLDQLKGSTWSGVLFGIPLSDPLSVLSQVFASYTLYWPLIITALLPLLVTLIFGRVFCGWICPATLLYELNDNLRTWLTRLDMPIINRTFDKRIKYGVLATTLLLCSLTGSILTAAVYPPSVIGREIYYFIVLGGFSIGMLFFIATLLFDLLVSQRGFCRYLCPGGALFSLLGRFRLVRIQRNVSRCNDCTKCDATCQFGLQPMTDGFGQECNNCTACMSVCPNNALQLAIKLSDQAYSGPGHLGRKYRQHGSSQRDEVANHVI